MLICMNELSFVRDRLERSVGHLRQVASDTGISYDTLLRIKRGDVDPGYSKVHALWMYFRRSASTGRIAATRYVTKQRVKKIP